MSVAFFKALADETRLLLVMLIEQEHELCVCELTFALALTQPKISRHLALLRDAKIIEARRQGKWMFYRLNHSLPSWQLSSIQAARAASSAPLQKITEQLAGYGERPERLSQCC